VTESAAIGSATEAISRLNVSDAAKATMASNVAVAYAVTYIFGTVGATWFLSRVGPKLLSIDLTEECKKAEAELGGKEEPGVFSLHTDMIVRAYRAAGAKVANRTVREFEADYRGRVAVQLIRHGSDVVDAESDTIIRAGDAFSMVGPRRELTDHANDIGDEVYDRDVLDFPLKSLDVVVTNKSLEGLTLTRIGHQHGRGVRVMKIIRMGEQMPITPNTRIYRGDTLTLFGAARDVERAAGVAGYADRASASVGMVWISTGIVLGALIGIPAIVVKDVAITLSTAGGILVMGLIFGYVRARHPVFGRMPESAEWVFENVGLATFVAIVGLTGSVGFFNGVRENGVGLLVVGLLIALAPPTVMLLVGRFVFPQMNRAVLLGVASGASTTTASLHALQEVSQSRVPSLGYTVPYAIGGVLTVAWGPVLVAIVPNIPK
jgi:putative transport protein